MDATSPVTRIPTIDDLRVKLCYICQDEEVQGPISDPQSNLTISTTSHEPSPTARAWVHPCKCTLIAHERCLLKWIQTAQSRKEGSKNALKCPQCGVKYQLESNNPVVLRLLNAARRGWEATGGTLMLLGFGSVVGAIVTSVYVVFTGYGAWALRRYIGTEAFEQLIGNDPASWPWVAFLNLPYIPYALIWSRFKNAHSPVLPVLFALTSIPPIYNIRRSESGSFFESARSLIGLPTPQDPVTALWPPSPVIFAFAVLPLVQRLYRKAYRWAYLELMGKPPPRIPSVWRDNENDNGNANANDNADAAPAVNADAGNDADANANAGGADEARMGGRWQIQQIDVDIFGPAQGRAREANAPGAPAQPARRNNGQNANANANGDREVGIQINVSAMGHFVAGALLSPAIASWMGNLLLRFSHRSSLLRGFLGIRPSIGSSVWLPSPIDVGNKDMHGLSALKQVAVGVHTIVREYWVGSKSFSEGDPVWWRNSVGLGLFIVAKDAAHLLHLWLAKRELASRKLKSRDFSGVDVKALDLLQPGLFGVPPPSS